jgi:hypothetical protein
MVQPEERPLLPGWRGKVRNFGQRYAARLVHRHEQRQGMFGEATSIDFSWGGSDEMTEVCGDGSAELQSDGSLHGEICYRHGDEYSFIARKWTSSTAC